MISTFLRLIKFSHTIFALPFALLGYFIGVRHFGFDYVILLQVIVAMVFARSAAMGFNRIVDREWDAKNSRTAGREIPSGQISTKTVAIIVAVCSCLFVLTALSINMLCFLLSPVALVVILGYSYTKRFTSWAHVALGVALSISPMGAYIAVGGTLVWEVVLLAGVVAMWVAGFDIIFALQDEEFDRAEGLHSMPARLGTRGALWVSGVCHILSGVMVVALGFMLDVDAVIYFSGAAIFIAILCYEHIVVTPSKRDRVGFAFATLNSVASVFYCLFSIASLYFS